MSSAPIVKSSATLRLVSDITSITVLEVQVTQKSQYSLIFQFSDKFSFWFFFLVLEVTIKKISFREVAARGFV